MGLKISFANLTRKDYNQTQASHIQPLAQQKWIQLGSSMADEKEIKFYFELLKLTPVLLNCLI
jgi:hypothetical protein